jgi:monoterpene epsilon-lactone hydrolase
VRPESQSRRVTGRHRFLCVGSLVCTGMDRDVVKEMYGRWAAGESPGDDSWGDITTEPGGVDYLEADAAGVPAMWIEPHGAVRDRVIVAYHGGGFVSGSLYSHRKLFGHLAKAAGVRVLLVHNRLAPEFAYPAQIEDALAAYRWVASQAGTVALAGDSSGAGLAVQVALRTDGAAALLLMSPWVDMEVSGETFESNADTDLVFTRAMVEGLVKMYLQNGESPSDPQVNALYADLAGLPPMFLQVGSDETCLDDSRRLAARAGAAGVDVRLDVFEGRLHTFQMAAGRMADADDAIRRYAAWVRPKLGL